MKIIQEMIMLEIDATRNVGCQMMITENDHGRMMIIISDDSRCDNNRK